MQATSNTWKSLAAMDGVYVESKAIVDGVEYTDIEPPVITRALMQNGLEVGNVVSAVCQFELDTSASIPKSAEVQIKTRLVGYANDTPIYSEWLPQGTFYVSKRTNDPRISVQRFECYDALLKTNAVWVPASSVWPQNTSSVVAEILGNIGLQLDSRTTIVAYSISEPSAGTTMRDVLGIIAQQNGGNWIVTPENKLRLVPVVDLSESESADVIIDVDAVISEYYTGEIKTITGVKFAVEDENDSIIGDDTGAVVSLTVPGIIALDVADLLIGKTYRPFSYGTAYYDIAAELGDYIQCEDAVSVIYAETVTLGTGMHGDISAPDLAEIVDEYPYVGSNNKTLVAAKAYAKEYTDDAIDGYDQDLTQQEIFNRLVGDPPAQGLVLYNGQLYINASYINAGYLNVGRVNFNEPSRYYDVPNENDPASLLSGQTVADGWIVNTSGSGNITVFSCEFAIPLRGKTVTVTFAFNGNLDGGENTWTSISDNAFEMWDIQDWLVPSSGTPSNPYTYSVTVPSDAMSFRIAMECAGLKQIAVSLSSQVTPSESIVYNYEGLRLGEGNTKFQVYRDGTLITTGKSLFHDPVRMNRLYLNTPLDVASGGTGARNAAGARTNLEITPANIGAVAKSGDTMTGVLNINSNIIQTAGYIKGENYSATNHALKLGHSGDDHMKFFEYGGVFTFYQSRGGTDTAIFQIKNGLSDTPLPVNNGGTGATTGAQALINMGASIYLNTSTISTLYDILKNLETNYPVCIRLNNDAIQALSGKSISGGYGTVVKTGVESGTLVLSFDICYVAGNYRHAFTTRVSQTTITPGAVYRYTGTAVS